MERKIRMRLELGESAKSFKLESAVCNHGFFMMAPNIWNPQTKSLLRPLRLSDSITSVLVSISQHPAVPNFLHLEVLNAPSNRLSPQDHDHILSQVRRMLRISDEDERNMEEFHRLHPQAKEKGFGRIFRSPTLFEDIVKSILLCNCSWRRSLKMAKALCDLQLKMSTRRTRNKVKHEFRIGNFPSPKEIASLSKNTLDKVCKLGHRTYKVVKLVQMIETSKLKLRILEEAGYDHKLYTKLFNIKGFGPFTRANIMMCTGFYEKIPIDTETMQHLKQVHGIEMVKELREVDVAQVYNKYNPFQCLAYWMERVDYYEKKFGRLSELSSSDYENVTSTGTFPATNHQFH